jgi:hypothetical protein
MRPSDPRRDSTGPSADGRERRASPEGWRNPATESYARARNQPLESAGPVNNGSSNRVNGVNPLYEAMRRAKAHTKFPKPTSVQFAALRRAYELATRRSVYPKMNTALALIWELHGPAGATLIADLAAVHGPRDLLIRVLDVRRREPER